MEKPNIPYPRRLVTPWPAIRKLAHSKPARRRRILFGGLIFWAIIGFALAAGLMAKLSVIILLGMTWAAWCVAVTAVWSAYAAARWASYGVASGMGVFS